jgi:hypothetical protein
MIDFAQTSANVMSYDEALLYCAFCNYGGHKDWRLPTYKEFRAYAMDILAENHLRDMRGVEYLPLAVSAWHQGSILKVGSSARFHVLPVRDC